MFLVTERKCRLKILSVILLQPGLSIFILFTLYIHILLAILP